MLVVFCFSTIFAVDNSVLALNNKFVILLVAEGVVKWFQPFFSKGLHISPTNATFVAFSCFSY